MNMLTIRSATAADSPVVGRILGDAFRDDPTWALFFPDPATRSEKLATYYERQVRRHPERVDVAMDDALDEQGRESIDRYLSFDSPRQLVLESVAAWEDAVGRAVVDHAVANRDLVTMVVDAA